MARLPGNDTPPELQPRDIRPLSISRPTRKAALLCLLHNAFYGMMHHLSADFPAQSHRSSRMMTIRMLLRSLTHAAVSCRVQRRYESCLVQMVWPPDTLAGLLTKKLRRCDAEASEANEAVLWLNQVESPCALSHDYFLSYPGS